jgi:hypothetical protein
MSWLRPDFPGQDSCILNDDWVIQRTKDFLEMAENNFHDLLVKFLSQINLDVLYIEDTETIQLSIEKPD